MRARRSKRIYRNVECGTWNSADFRALSAPEKPSAQFLWLYLMTGPQTGPIPGLYCFSVAETAERFNWPIKGTRSALQEIIDREMALYDEPTRVLWLPKALKEDRNAPASPNVVRSWRRAWAELPRSETVTMAAVLVEDSMRGIGEAFVKALHEVIGEDLRQAIAHPSRNQETAAATLNKTKTKIPTSTVPRSENLPGHDRAREAPRNPDGIVGFSVGGES